MRKAYLSLLIALFAGYVVFSIYNIHTQKVAHQDLQLKMNQAIAEIDSDKEKITEISMELNNYKSRYEKLLQELEQNKIIARTQIIDLIEGEINSLSANFSIYEKKFQNIITQMKWIETNISPEIKKYGVYMKATAVASSFLPVPYISMISDAITGTLAFVDLTDEYITLVNEVKISMANIQALQQQYAETKNENILLEACENVNEVLFVKLKQIIAFSESLVLRCDETINTLKSVKEFKETIVEKTHSGFAKLASFFTSSTTLEKPAEYKNSQSDIDMIDELIANLSERTNEIKDSSSKNAADFKTDLLSFGNLMSFNRFLRLIDSTK